MRLIYERSVMSLFRRTRRQAPVSLPCNSRRGRLFGHHQWGWLRNRGGEYLGQETQGETVTIGDREWVRGCVWCRAIHPELKALDSAVVSLISRGLVHNNKLPDDFDLLRESFRGRRNGNYVESVVKKHELTPRVIAHARELASIPPDGIEAVR